MEPFHEGHSSLARESIDRDRKSFAYQFVPSFFHLPEMSEKDSSIRFRPIAMIVFQAALPFETVKEISNKNKSMLQLVTAG